MPHLAGHEVLLQPGIGETVSEVDGTAIDLIAGTGRVGTLVVKDLRYITRESLGRTAFVVVVGISSTIQIALIAGTGEELDGDSHGNLALGLDVSSDADTETAVTLEETSYAIVLPDAVRVAPEILDDFRRDMGLSREPGAEELD